jgi:hypothetical protein
LVIASALFTFSNARAQSTVFNIASTDVLPAHQGYIEADFMAHLSSYENGGYQTYGPRVVYGLGRRTEVGLNAFYTRTSPAEPFEIQPNFKWKFYENENKGLAAAAGGIAFIPVSERSSVSTRGMAYAVVSKNIQGSFGPRFTVGSYALIGSFDKGTSKNGLLLGYEQPLSKRLTFVTDWSSGNNDYGYLAAGAGITLSPKSVLYVGYNIGNQGRGNNSLGLYYGFTF